jgi:ParB-like chromosome segregation protein Spo0J
MEIKTVPIGQVLPYIRNPRKNEAAVDKVAASIKEFGWRQPIVVDEKGVIIAGHTRLLAAQRLGLAEVPVHVAVELSEAQVKAYRLMDNRSGQEAEWDLDLLSHEFADLKEMKFDLEFTGFEQDEIAALFGGGTEGLTDPDAVPEPPDDAIT